MFKYFQYIPESKPCLYFEFNKTKRRCLKTKQRRRFLRRATELQGINYSLHRCSTPQIFAAYLQDLCASRGKNSALGGHEHSIFSKHESRAIHCKSALVPRLRAFRFYPCHAQQWNFFQLLLQRCNDTKV